MLSREN
jgi:hypothetical protein